jgi:uncharacterized protein (DUF1501 family)
MPLKNNFMNRRKFIGNTALATVPIMLTGIPVFAGEGVLHPFLQALSASAANCGKVLVIIQLNGGNDGLNMVIPIDQYANLAAARPDVILPQSSLAATTITATTALHPAMTGIKNMYADGKVSIVQGVTYPNPNFSHFFAQNIWFSGTTNPSATTGWVGRQLETTFPTFPTGFPNATNPDPMAIQIGGSLPLSLLGTDVNFGYNAPNPAALITVATAVPEPAPISDYGTELTFLRQMRNQSNVYAGRISTAYGLQATLSTMYPATGNNLAAQLKVVARLIGGGLATPVYIVNQSDAGYDTHENQVVATDHTTGNHATNLSKLSVAIAAFQNDITLMGKANKVTGMTFSEFGRRVISNSSVGTDHGTGAPVIFFGDGVEGGILGTSPIIPAVTNGNTQVPMQYDFRQLYSTLMQKWMCMTNTETQAILGSTFNTIGIFKANPLPITGTELLARWENDYALLEFKVFENDSYERFVVERSTDGNSFSAVLTKVNISNNNVEQYAVKDNRISASEVYYRIKAFSKQGEISYSKIAILRNVVKQGLSVYPNPVTNHTINIEFFTAVNEDVTITIIGTLGEKLYYNQVNPRGNRVLTFKVPHHFDVRTLYILNIRYGGSVVNEKLIFE